MCEALYSFYIVKDYKFNCYRCINVAFCIFLEVFIDFFLGLYMGFTQFYVFVLLNDLIN
jgi:hypothetical protein